VCMIGLHAFAQARDRWRTNRGVRADHPQSRTAENIERVLVLLAKDRRLTAIKNRIGIMVLANTQREPSSMKIWDREDHEDRFRIV